jgi:dipeptidyl aminopeptidase/acylaminoacyl peptidase
MPDTDLWLFKTIKDKLKNNVVAEPVNFTNRPGYDNQPAFSEDGSRIYYVSVFADKQADIYYYDLKSKKTVKLTNTKESEYSPSFSPDQKHIGSVVVESDSAQRIHYLNALTGTNESRFQFDSVGYFAFLNNDTIVYYKLTEPHSLHYFIRGSEEDRFLCSSPIRTFKPINRHSFIYGIKDTNKVVFYKYDFLLHKAWKYAEYNSLNEDIYWHPQFGLMKSEEKKILYYDEAKRKWTTLYDLSLFGIKKITRFAFDPKNNYLVIVNNP